MNDDLDRGLDAAASLGDPVRRRLYRYVLASATPVTRDDVAGGAGVSRSTAAYHLDRLADAGLVDVRFERQTGRSGPGAGRPAKLYERPREPVAVSLPRRRYELLAGLLADAVEGSPAAESALRGAARRHGERLARSHLAAAATPASTRADATPAAATPASTRADATPAGADPAPHLTDPAPHLSDPAPRFTDPAPADRVQPTVRGVLAGIGYEPYVDGGAVRLRNCPFASVAERHRELVCGANLALVDGIVAALGDGTERAVLDPGPDRCCVAVRPAA
jgi:predicted ArsR family transcriptional regulator